MEKLFDIAKYFFSKNHFLTDKQIQKLVYYAYAWYLVRNNPNKDNITNRLCTQHPEAWVHGPVFYDLYEEMTYNRLGFITREINLDVNMQNFLNVIYNVYGKYSGNQLEDMTHNETPWIIARFGYAPNQRSREEMDDAQIYEYFSK